MENILGEATKSPKTLSKQRSFSLSFCSPKLPICLLFTFFIVFIIFQIQAFKDPFSSSFSCSCFQQWDKLFKSNLNSNSSPIASRLRESVTFLPLKDIRYAKTPTEGHTWFMSSMNDTYEKDESEYLYFPSEGSKGRLLCLMGRDVSEGGWNSYALSWPETMPANTTLLRGTTFVSETHYDYSNLWHGLSAMVPFVAWHKRKECVVPARWVLYHWGELRSKMGSWLQNLMEATFREKMKIERFDGDGLNGRPYCFEKAVVFRHNEGKMVAEKRGEVYDLLRCKARLFCNISLSNMGADVTDTGVPIIGLTLLLRTGARSFKNESAVVEIFKKECEKVDGCMLTIARSNGLSFCDQVKLMSSTDIIATPHGAQLTNMFLMDRNSSVMEFFPRGWLELMGVGQYVFHWMASWSGMRHEGVWRDSDGEQCPHPMQDPRCLTFYKNGFIGHNQTFFANWAMAVINRVKINKMDKASKGIVQRTQLNASACLCG